MRKLANQVHLWLGLSSGLVVFVVALTGALWAFESEISDLLYSYRTVEIRDQGFLPPSEIRKIVAPYFGAKHIRRISYAGKDRPIECVHWNKETEEQLRVFVNPYSGEVLKVLHNEQDFFEIVLELHVNLLLGETGKYMVDYATLIFLVLLITGWILWWPRHKGAVKQRLLIQWKEGFRWKRKNFDLHTVLGFYSSVIVLFISLTGLSWAFTWMDKALYTITSGGATYTKWEKVLSVSDSTRVHPSAIDDTIYQSIVRLYQKPFESIYLYPPATKSESYYGYISPDAHTWHQAEGFYFDQRTGAVLKEERQATMNSGEKLRNMYYDIHIGKILGFPGQLLVFFASLTVASLPITGFCIWYGRRKKLDRSL